MADVRCGVYLIRNTTDGKVYVGSSIDIDKRWQSHVNQMKGNRHQNAHLQSAWKKFGQDAFEFTVIEFCPEGTLIIREVVWVEYYDSLNPDKGYNLEYPDRRGHTEETKKKISASHTGNPKCMGKKPRGFHHSEETKRKIAESRKGKCVGHTVSDDARRRISEARRGKPLSEEHKAKLSLAHKGKEISSEHRAKLSESIKKTWHSSRHKGLNTNE